VEYLPPREINVRRVYADNSTTPVVFRAAIKATPPPSAF